MFGWRTLTTDHRFTHDTHPDDSFLPNANTPGSAGTTSFSRLEFVHLGFGYEAHVTEHLALTIDAGGMLGANLTSHQNDNDFRPAKDGAFVYSQADFGVFANAGLAWSFGPVRVGGEAQLAGVWIESGWDRYSTLQSVDHTFEQMISIGPKLGIRLGEHCSVEVATMFGDSESIVIQFRGHH